MKKAVQAVICVIIAGVLAIGGYMFGLKAQQSSITNAVPKQSISDEKKHDKQPQITESADSGKYIGKSDATSVEDNWSVVSEYRMDITDDGKEDKITLYTSAVSENGETEWDDSQKWALEIFDGSSYYTLLNQSVTNGNIYFDIREDDNHNKTVSVYIVTSVEAIIKQYTYNKTGFVEQQVYSTGVGNRIYNSIPAYK